MSKASETNQLVDRARDVREGEELDGEGLRRYLRGVLGEEIGPLTIKQFPGGHSNLTYAVSWQSPSQPSETLEYVLRRPPYGTKVKKAHDMGREYRVLCRLAPVYPPAPAPLFFCQDPDVLGADFYLMERKRGFILRRDPPAGMTLDAPLARRLCETLFDALVEFHGLDYQAIGLGDLGKPEGYVERQVTGWTRRYGAAKTDEVAEIDQVATWLAENIPDSGPATLIHNDFKFDNVILDENDLGRVLGILDWEMCTVGDPLMDLGTSLAYWVEAGDGPVLQKLRFGPTQQPGMMTRAEASEYYATRSGRDTSNIVFYYCFGLFKTAVVVQQIYYRYVKGHTKDERFAQLGLAARALAHQATQVLERDRISW